MKKRADILWTILLISIALHAEAQNSPKTVLDTSKAWKKKYQPVVIPDPPVTGPILRTDSQSLYNNRIYENGIKGAEYQNRGAEDRRNINPANPNAIPNKQVPAKEVLPPDTVK
jgi:hypothetical protein